MEKVKRAIISVYNKGGIVRFASALCDMGIEIVSTGGTYKLLAENGLQVREVSEYTGFPEMLDGRVKTLHPMIHGGILGRRDALSHQTEMHAHGIEPIDMVVVNLYPFQATVKRPDVTLAEAIENIDIGGPAMLRSAAKNYQDVAVVVDPEDYNDIIEEMKRSGGVLAEQRRFSLAQKVFSYTSDYDQAIFLYFMGIDARPGSFPNRLILSFEKAQDLRYGENPHQQAALYKKVAGHLPRKLSGKEMSYNNFLDVYAAMALAGEFSELAAVIVKHNNPCGVATGETLVAAYRKAKATDPASAFGGVAAFNGTLDAETAEEITATFMEVVVAKKVSHEALSILQRKKDLRVLESDMAVFEKERIDIRCVADGLLVQDYDSAMGADLSGLRVVSDRHPTSAELSALSFAWKVVKHVKSNAIVFAQPGQTVGIGAGQMSRVDSVKIAKMKAHLPTSDCVMASDAFFPFRDGIDAAAEAGISAVIQPGGSIRDQEVIQAANDHKMAMVLTGIRHFRH